MLRSKLTVRNFLLLMVRLRLLTDRFSTVSNCSVPMQVRHTVRVRVRIKVRFWVRVK